MNYFMSSKGLSRKTILIYTYWINRFLVFSKNKQTKSLIFKFRERCMQIYSIDTQKVILSAMKIFIEYKNLSIKITLPKTNWVLKGTIISMEEYNDLLGLTFHCNSFVSIRNKEIIKVLWKTGMRVGELINLKWKDIDPTYITITSKNNRTRRIPYKKGMFNSLRKISLGKYVFNSKTSEKISYSTIYNIFKKYNRNISPHTMRHSFATRLINKGVPLNFVSELLGHSNINTTLSYLHFDNKELIRILEEKEWF